MYSLRQDHPHRRHCACTIGAMPSLQSLEGQLLQEGRVLGFEHSVEAVQLLLPLLALFKSLKVFTVLVDEAPLHVESVLTIVLLIIPLGVAQAIDLKAPANLLLNHCQFEHKQGLKVCPCAC